MYPSGGPRSKHYAQYIIIVIAIPCAYLIGVSVIRALLLSPDARPARLPPVTMCVLKLPSGNEEDGLDDSDVLSLQ